MEKEEEEEEVEVMEKAHCEKYPYVCAELYSVTDKLMYFYHSLTPARKVWCTYYKNCPALRVTVC